MYFRFHPVRFYCALNFIVNFMQKSINYISLSFEIAFISTHIRRRTQLHHPRLFFFSVIFSFLLGSTGFWFFFFSFSQPFLFMFLLHALFFSIFFHRCMNHTYTSRERGNLCITQHKTERNEQKSNKNEMNKNQQTRKRDLYLHFCIELVYECVCAEVFFLFKRMKTNITCNDVSARE